MKLSVDKSNLVFTRPSLHGGLQPPHICWRGNTAGHKQFRRYLEWVTFPESQLHHGLHQKRHDQQVKGGDSPPLFCYCETTWNTVSSSVAPSIIEQVQRKTKKIIRQLVQLSYDFLQGLMALNWKRLGLN